MTAFQAATQAKNPQHQPLAAHGFDVLQWLEKVADKGGLME
jgi:hypothetical protein